MGRNLAVGLAAILWGVSSASALVYTGSSGNLAASVDFQLNGNTLTVVLANTSTADVLVPSEVLTGLFFNGPAFSPISALLAPGSTVLFGPDGGGNVGGEWAYSSSVLFHPSGANSGISSAGLGLFGGANFNGPTLQAPDAVDGLDYGITSQGDNPASGNAEVTGNVALIQNSVTFNLDNVPNGFQLSDISNVSFQYGTSLTEPIVPGRPSGGGGPSVPDGGTTVMMLGIGLLGLGSWHRLANR